MATSLPTLAEIKAALGIESSDTSKDAAIESMLETTISIVENYLGRGIQSAPMVEEFEPPDAGKPKLVLYRFPVESVNSITQDGVELTGWHVEKQSGVIRWRGWRGSLRRTCCDDLDVPVVVDYVGGYADDEWPNALAEAVMRAFYVRWNATGNSGNVAEVVNASGNNRSVSVDGLTITRDSQMYAGEAFAGHPVPPELTSVAAMLDPYRQRMATGV